MNKKLKWYNNGGIVYNECPVSNDAECSVCKELKDIKAKVKAAIALAE